MTYNILQVLTSGMVVDYHGGRKMEIYKTVIFTMVGLAKFFGLIIFGMSLGWLILDAYKNNNKPWQTQVMFLAGLFALLTAMALRVQIGLAGFAVGFGLAVFMWGLPKKLKKED